MSQTRNKGSSSRFTLPAAITFYRRLIITLAVGGLVGVTLKALFNNANDNIIEDTNDKRNDLQQQINNLANIMQEMAINITQWNTTLFDKFSTTINTMNATGQVFTDVVSDLIYSNKTCMQTWDGLFKTNDGCENVKDLIKFYFEPYPICTQMIKFYCKNEGNITAFHEYWNYPITAGPTNLTCGEIYRQKPFVFCYNDFFGDFYFFGYDESSVIPYFTQECISVFNTVCYDLMSLRKELYDLMPQNRDLNNQLNSISADVWMPRQTIGLSVLTGIATAALSWLSCIGLNLLVDPAYRRHGMMFSFNSENDEDKKPLLEEGNASISERKLTN